MPEDINPSGTGTDTLPSSADADGLSPDGQAGFIPLSKYEQDLAVERKRRAGQEKAHAKQMDEMRKELDAVKSTLQVNGSTQRPTIDLSRLDPNDPKDAAILAIYENQVEWQSDLKKRYQSEQHSARLNEAMTEATKAGVPIDELELDSPETIRASMQDYLHRKELADMKAEIEKLKSDKEIAYTTGRAETGATVVSTATGGASRVNPNLQQIQEQRKAVQDELVEFKRKNDLVGVHNANRALTILKEQEQAALSRGR